MENIQYSDVLSKSLCDLSRIIVYVNGRVIVLRQHLHKLDIAGMQFIETAAMNIPAA